MAYTPQRYDVKTFLIYIDSYENGVPVGQYHNPCREESGQFQSMTQLLLKVEQSLDVENIPQSFNKVRTFFPLTGYWLDVPADVRPRMGKMSTFVVQILFRRNASWQGTITWLDKKQTQNFRSVMELIVLMNSALEGTKYSQWQVPEEEYSEVAE
ncbi:MAG: hypothetical protein IJ374_08745 [Lachnospiraceae bacterium]|nr:hypothetical protein [Lachnospiraceae bacterium]